MVNRPKKGVDPAADALASRDASSMTLLVTIADTTWRMFVPSVGFTLLGVWLDGEFDSKPWLMFAGIALGCALAVMLVWRQIGAIKRAGDV